MNILFFELKSQIKSFIIWTVSILGAFVVFMAGIYPSFADSVDTIKQILLHYPKQFSAAFGMDAATIFSYKGFFGFGFSYLSLIGAIMTVVFTLSIFAREKRSKCVDFILTKPKSRFKIFTQKVTAVLLLLVLNNIIFVFISIPMFIKNDVNDMYQIGLASCALFFSELVFFALSLLIAVFANKIRSISGLATAVGFGAFILTAFANILNDEIAKFIAPLKYFNPTDIFINGGFDWGLVVFATVLIIFCIVVAYVKFCRSDAHAV